MWWLGAAAVLVGTIVLARVSARRQRTELGSLSDQWIAEHKTDTP